MSPWGPSYDRLKRVTVNLVSKLGQILRISVISAISQAPSGLFQKFQHPWSIVCNWLTYKKGSRSKAPLGAELRPLKEGNRQRNLANFDRYCSSMFKRSFLRPGGVFLRNSKTQNQQMGVSQPWGKDPGQLAPRKASYVQSNCVMRHRLWAIILQKNHISGLEWCFWAIQKPRINSLVCFGFRTGFQVIGPPRGPNYGHSKEPRLVFSDFLGGLLIRSIYLGMLPTQYPH